jgi:outer membrane protein OmpA-like peptidoglycan-associated protein
MRVLIIILWLLLGLFYWYISKQCCTQNPETVQETISQVPSIPVKKITKLTPINFACSDDKPNAEPEWMKFRDSLINNMGKDSVLSIKGLYFSDEVYQGNENLGLARARNVLKLFDNLNTDLVQLDGEGRQDSCVVDELNNLIAFRYLRQTAKIKEIDDRTIIHFAFNSAKKLSDSEIEKYLDDVAARVSNSAEKILLTGHTDDVGSDAANILLGEKRAETIKDYLVRKGVNPSNITVRSKGERSPIALNQSEEGRNKNRRVELQIIK